MKTIRALGLSLFIFVLTICYTNCSGPIQFVSSLEKTNMTSDNNAGAYGGKASYYRYLPDFTCEKTESPQSILNLVDSGQVIETVNSSLKCNLTQTTLDMSSVDKSVFQNEIVGLREGIYEGNDLNPNVIPANLVEVWCRDAKDITGTEIIAHFDRTSRTAVARIYTSAGTTPDFSVTRTVSAHRVVLRNTSGFALTVYRDRPSLIAGLFEGEYNAQKTTCRLGGTLDPRIWPVKQVLDISVDAMKMSPDSHYYAFNSPLLGVILLEGSAKNPVLLNGFSHNYQTGFEFTPNSQYLIHNSIQQGSVPELYRLDLKNKTNVLLSQLSTTIAGQVAPDFMVSADGKLVVFKEGKEYPSLLRHTLKSISINGGASHQIEPPFSYADYPSSATDEGVKHFVVSHPAGKVIFLAGPRYPQLFVANLDGSDLKKITPPSFCVENHCASRLTHQWYMGMKLSDDGFSFTVDYVDWGLSTVPRKSYRTDLNGRFYEFLPTPNIGNMSANPDADTRKEVLPAGPAASLCPEMTGEFLGSVQGASKKVFLSFDSTNKILSIFSKSAQGNCQKVNSVISKLDPLSRSIYARAGQSQTILEADRLRGSQVILSPDGQKVLVNFSERELFYIPLEGGVPYLINAPVHREASLSKALFLSDSKTVFYIGDQIREGLPNAFRWTAP